MPREMTNLIDLIKPQLKKLNKFIIQAIYDYILSESNIPAKLEFLGVRIEEEDRSEWQNIYSQIDKYLKLNPKPKNFLIIKLNNALASIIGVNPDLKEKKRKPASPNQKTTNKQKDKSSTENTSSGPPKKRHKDESKKLNRNLVLEQAIADACNKVKVPSRGNNEGFQRCIHDAKGEPTKELAAVILIYPPENLSEQRKYEYGISIFEYIINALNLTKRSTKNILLKPLDKKEIEKFNENDNKYKTNEHVIAEITIPVAAPAGTVAIRGQTQVAVKKYFTGLQLNPSSDNPSKPVNNDSHEVAGFLLSMGTPVSNPHLVDRDDNDSASSGTTSKNSAEESSEKSAEYEAQSTSTNTVSQSKKPAQPKSGAPKQFLSPSPKKMPGSPLNYTDKTIQTDVQVRQYQQPLTSSVTAKPTPKSVSISLKKAAANRPRAQDFFYDDILDLADQSKAITPPKSRYIPTSTQIKAVDTSHPDTAVSQPIRGSEHSSNASRQLEETARDSIVDHQLVVAAIQKDSQQLTAKMDSPKESEYLQSTPSTTTPAIVATTSTQAGSMPAAANKSLKPKAASLAIADKNTSDELKRKREEALPVAKIVEDQIGQDLKSALKTSSAAVIMNTLQGTQEDPITLSGDEREFDERAAKLMRLAELKKQKDEKLAKALADKRSAQDEYRKLRDKRMADQQAQLDQLERELKKVDAQIEQTENEAQRYKSRRESMGS